MLHKNRVGEKFYVLRAVDNGTSVLTVTEIGTSVSWYGENATYCKSTNFGVLLYLANLANCVFSPIFVIANIYVDCTLHRRAAGRRQI